jgi:hypothetical protein
MTLHVLLRYVLVSLALGLAIAALPDAWNPVLFAAAATPAPAPTCQRQGCSKGYYFSDCDAQCKMCLPGYYCRGNLTQPASCAPGTYNQFAGKSKVTDCWSCPTGQTSGAAAPFCVECPPLQYAPNVFKGCVACPDGYVAKNGKCEKCPVGYFASNTTGVCEACAGGYACPSRTKDAEVICKPGTFSNFGDGRCSPCPRGYACPAITKDCSNNNATNRVACQPGTFSTGNMTTCKRCPPAFYCPNRRTARQIPCPRGYYSLGGQYKCTECPAGFKCDPAVNGSAPQACVAGQLSDGIKCNPCPVGFACPDPATKLPCDKGYYSAAGAVECTICPIGNFCPNATGKFLCPIGYFANNTGQSVCLSCVGETREQAVYQTTVGGSTCTICPSGSYCPRVTQSPIPCPNGTISGRGQYSCTMCQVSRPNEATYAPNNGSKYCFLCPAGSYCPTPNFNPIACPSGTYSLPGAFVCTLCPAGYQCPSPSLGPLICDSGSYSLGGLVWCKMCPPNARCPYVDQPPEACDVVSGFYSLPGSTVCETCPAGTGCIINAKGNVTFKGCQKGQYKEGSTCVACSPGFYCMNANTSTKLPCPIGTYSLRGSTTCFKCPAGKQCPGQASALTCAKGYYSYDFSGECQRCPRGFRCRMPWDKPIACPLGTYSLGQATNCTLCPRGFECPNTDAFMSLYCRPGTFSTGGQSKCTVCPAGYECPFTDRSYMRACPPGFYSTWGQKNCTGCPAGYACPKGNYDEQRPIPCPIGSFSTAFSTACTECPAGYACPFTTSNIKYKCQAGTFTGPGEALCLTCAAGHYCPNRAVAKTAPFFGTVGVGRQVECALGTYASAGSISCAACPKGYACRSIYAADGERVLCPPGWQTVKDGVYVLTGATDCAPCPFGVDCSIPGVAPKSCKPGQQATSTGCKACPAGYACPSPSIAPVPCAVGTFANNGSTECKPCSGGFVCQSISSTSSPKTGGCPVGHYCPPGTTAAVMCPAGTFGRKLRAKSEADGCVACLPGYYCPAGSAGLGSLVACPEGYYCPANSAIASPCPEGTYSTDRYAVARSACKTCPPGYFCPVGTSQYAPNTCPPGFYCPAGTSHGFDNPCPVGSYAEDRRLYSATQCLSCPAGFFCPASGLAAAIACPPGTYQNVPGSMLCKDCEPGWSCPASNMTHYSGSPCARGHYCPRGTTLPASTTCPGGSYSFRTNNKEMGDCEVCWRGYYCPHGTGYTVAAPQPCTAGSYCPGLPMPVNGEFHSFKFYQGTSAGAGNQFPCPPGSFSTATDLYQADQCSACPAGSYCLGGLTAVSGTCSAGYYCPANSSIATQVPCPAGTYRTTTGATRESDCLPCPAGRYCVAGTSTPAFCPAGRYTPDTGVELPGPPRDATERTCRDCPAGYFCPSPSTVPQPCAAGTYSDINAASCTMCDVGRYCPGKATSKADMNQLFVCPATLYCPSGTSRIPNTESDGCRVGYYCPEGTAAPMPCPAGTFNPHRGRGEVGECVQCTPGFYCGSSGLSNVTGECDPGHYCPAGSSSATQINCPPRYYRSTPRGENEDFCSVCPRGFYCPSGTSMPIPCPHGYYCVTGAEIPGPCPIGTFANVSGLRSQDECIPCSPGEYCDGLGLPIPTGLCDAGYYCIGRAQTSAPPGLPTGGLCPRGGYCPPGSSFPTSCDQGTFNNFTGGSTQNDCTACLPGYYCSGTNLPSPSGPCAAGYYCQGGAYLPTQFLTPLGHYSLAGSSAPEECPLGTFNPETGKSACVPCIEGYYCPTRAMTSYYPCPVGGYCPRGSTLPRACPIGTYQPFVRRQNVSDCLQCPEGSYCAKENATSPSGLCVAGYYCKRACVTSTCTQIVNSKREIENWFPVDNTTENQYGGECPLGKYCPDGTANPVRCPKGTIRDGTRGITADDSCTPCPGGFYCPNTGMSTQLQNNQPIPCQEGYFCPGKVPGSVNKGCEDPFCSTFRAQPCDINTIGCDGVVNVDLNLTIPQARVCPTGFFCPTGSILPTKCMPLRDGRSTFAPRRQQKACELCLPGRYCDINRVSTLQVPAICPRGRYCPIGSTPLMPRCPAGSWNPFTGLHNRTQCRLCPAGRYCPYAGTYATTVVQMPFCFGGYYCTKGAAAGDGRVGVLGGVAGVCRRGHYCVNGTMNITQFPCPPGTYKPIFGGSSAVTCLSCTPGKHCKGLGLMAPAGDCAPGYYCPRGCIDAYCSSRTCVSSIVPRLGWTGGACPKGHECVLGSHMPVPCKPGTYQTRTTSFSCTTCPPGYHCGLAAHSPEPCPEGYYCPGGTGTRSIPKCPIGTYNTWIRKTNLTDCLLCPAGQYCDRRAMNKSTGVCLPGFYCTSGAKHPNGTAGARGGIGGRCPQATTARPARSSRCSFRAHPARTTLPCRPPTSRRASDAPQACTAGRRGSRPQAALAPTATTARRAARTSTAATRRARATAASPCRTTGASTPSAASARPASTVHRSRSQACATVPPRPSCAQPARTRRMVR